MRNRMLKMIILLSKLLGKLAELLGYCSVNYLVNYLNCLVNSSVNYVSG